MTNSQLTTTPSAVFADSKPHYALLDGLRGAAALMVVWYHFFEGFAFAEGTAITTFNHGHLGVDLFFMLSGFVISYAYDDRWKASHNRLTMRDFFKRRLIRLHPMLVMGAVIGFITFLLGGGVQWDGTPTPLSWSIVALVLAMLFIPAYPGAPYDLRGNGEMFSLNGPSWSLFFEYIGNILYALIIRRLSTKMLAILTVISGCLHAWFFVGNISGYDMVGVGWTIDEINFWGGLVRMLFPFTVGMLLAQTFKPRKVKGAFWVCSLILVVLFSVPYIPSNSDISLNSLYEVVCIVVIFPFVVWLGACGICSGVTSKVNRVLGDISYPLYIVHYPIMYVFYAWLIEKKYYTLQDCWAVALLVVVSSILLAFLCLKLYDEPVRRWLSRKFIKR